MIIKENKTIKERGTLVENGSGDLEVRLRDKVIISIKSILINGNNTLKTIILDEHFVGYVELYEECSEIGYYEMEKYYSGGNLIICERNVCEILMFCLCYKDEEIINDCFTFLKSNIDDDILIKLIHISNIFPSGLKEIETNQMIEFEKRGHKYLYDYNYLMKLEINNLQSVLSLNNLIIRSETWLLNRLIEWYKFKTKYNGYNKDNNREFVDDFRYLIKESINYENIDENELKEENREILNKLDIELNNNVEMKYIDLYRIKNEEIQDLIINKFKRDEEMDFNKEEKEVLSKLKEEEISNAIFLLLDMNNAIVIELVILIMMFKKLKIKCFIPNAEKENVIRKLCLEYNSNQRKRTVKCLSLLINNKDRVLITESICGKEMIFRLVNNDYNLNSRCKEVIIQYLKEYKLSVDDEEKMNRIIDDIETLDDLKTREITIFSYNHSQYSFSINNEVSIIPSFDGNRCNFSVNPSLPSGITIDEENGIISGKTDTIMEKKEYEVTCKNIKNEKKFKIKLVFKDIKFIDYNKSDGMTISDNGMVITNTVCNQNHCYLNLKMSYGTYHIKYKFYKGHYDYMFLGLSRDYAYSGCCIYSQITTCNYYAEYGKSQEITKYCHIGRVINSNPSFSHGDGSIYEVIVDMNKREFWISHNNSNPVLLVKDLPSPLYPYAALFWTNTFIELISVSHHN